MQKALTISQASVSLIDSFRRQTQTQQQQQQQRTDFFFSGGGGNNGFDPLLPSPHLSSPVAIRRAIPASQANGSLGGPFVRPSPKTVP